MNKKSFINDSLKTIFGSLLYMFTIQFILFPSLSHHYSQKEFGVILTIYSVMTLLSVVVGSTLNNIRLINISRFRKRYISKEFLLLLLSLVLISEVFLYFILKLYFKMDSSSVLILLFLLAFLNLKNYLQVHFRINFQFNNLLALVILQAITIFILVISNSFMNIGWERILLINEFIGVLFIVATFMKYKLEPSFKKEEFIFISKHYTNLAIINLVNNIIIYFDRFIIIIFISANAVSIAFLVTFVGKLIGSVISPINSVVLTYLSQTDIPKKRLLSILVIFAIIITISGTIISYPLSIVVIKYLYHEEVSNYIQYILVGNFGVILTVVGNFLFVFNMKYVPFKYQTSSQIIFFISYFIITIPSTYLCGLNGFFIAVICSNLIRIISIYYYGKKYSEVKI
ncbi:hypothetical protein [Macrococcoides caseolyticum]|uniref:Capsular biosynthesis protein n=1 Tax=Macrococcoides caseolyticum TaxID=69966 RepID=A0A855GKC8_9STAP|nr:hypothetical protein [Macrococcus caseolyticus]PKE12565.1 hypothetical protein CW685_03370 [Macrococcus caseolyticus]PKE26389.1 hypothetical protein CW686_05370 [Macrococcus caseolyticus]PKE48970.1 hypothetical protein CW677_02135 [Macrococcus caseolyticus]PKE58903.1 hypothetical protein CW673_05490 [Macrococcus caseolyticus]PKE69869.1 hypothetical protein CW662_06990 [Macrococcus caseolyticus]